MGVAMNRPIAVFRRWLREHEAEWRGKPFRELDLDRLFPRRKVWGLETAVEALRACDAVARELPEPPSVVLHLSLTMTTRLERRQPSIERWAWPGPVLTPPLIYLGERPLLADWMDEEYRSTVVTPEWMTDLDVVYRVHRDPESRRCDWEFGRDFAISLKREESSP